MVKCSSCGKEIDMLDDKCKHCQDKKTVGKKTEQAIGDIVSTFF